MDFPEKKRFCYVILRSSIEILLNFLNVPYDVHLGNPYKRYSLCILYLSQISRTSKMSSENSTKIDLGAIFNVAASGDPHHRFFIILVRNSQYPFKFDIRNVSKPAMAYWPNENNWSTECLLKEHHWYTIKNTRQPWGFIWALE